MTHQQTFAREALRQKLRHLKRLPRPPRPRQPVQLQREYYRKLLKVIAVARASIDKHVTPHLSSWLERARVARGDSIIDSVTRADDVFDDIRAAIGQVTISVQIAFRAPVIDELARDQALDINKQGAEDTKRIFKVLGIDPMNYEPWLDHAVDAFTAENVGLIQSLGDDYIDDVRQRVIAAVRNGQSTADLAADLADRYDVADSKAAFIARDQTSKFLGDLAQLRQGNLGITHYIWRGTLDQRERDSHRAHEGKRYAWTDPPAGTGHPGEDFNCRCTAEPDFSEILED